MQGSHLLSGALGLFFFTTALTARRSGAAGGGLPGLQQPGGPNSPADGEFDHCDWWGCEKRGVDMVEGRHYCRAHYIVAWAHELRLRRDGRA